MFNTISEFFNVRTAERIQRSKHYDKQSKAWIMRTVYAIMFGLFVLMTMAWLSKDSDNYLHAPYVVLWYYIGSAILGVFVCYALQIFAPRFADYRFSQGFVSTWIGCLVFFGGLGIGFFLNKIGATTQEKDYTILGFGKVRHNHGLNNPTTITQYYAKLTDDKDTILAFFTERYNDEHHIGQTVPVFVHHGLFGFDWIERKD